MPESNAIERWLPIPGHDGYEVSDRGRVRSLDRRVAHKNGNVHRRRGQILTPGRVGRERRLAVQLGRGRWRYVSLLVLEAFIGPRPPGMEGCHDNGDFLDNRLSNLRWDSKSANKIDMQRHGTNHWRNRTHCPRDHPLVEPNLVAREARRGQRSCLACARAKANQQKAGLRGVPFDFESAADRHYEKIVAEADGPRRRLDSDCCVYGHRLVEPNLSPYGVAKGHRVCVACSRARSSVRAAQRHGVNLDHQAESDRHYERIMSEG